MWQAPNQRIRAQANAKKRDRDRVAGAFHIKRVAASIKLTVSGGEPMLIDARVLLNDFAPGGMGLFTAHRFNPDEEVVVCLESPRKIELKGRIAWCQEYHVVGKILKVQACSYRAGIQFLFATKEEEKAIQDFCDELLNTYHCISLRVA